MLRNTIFLSLCFMAILLVASCTNSTSPNLEESLDLFAGLEVIPEAQQTNVTINKGTNATDGYFTIQIDNIDATPLLAPGVHEAWCLEWQKNLRSNGDVHQEVKWFSTGNNEKWKPLNYLFSIRQELQADDPDLTFRDIQAVVWVLAGEMGIAPEFDVLKLPVDRIPSRLRNGSELAIDREKVASIARRVMEEAPEAVGVPSGTVAQTAADQQDTYTPPSSLIKSTVVDETARTITILVDAGDGNTITELDLPGLEGLTGSVIEGGPGLQTATLLLESDGSDTYSYAVTVVNSIHQESSVVVTDQLWPPLVRQRVAFTSGRNGNFQIYVVDADGTNLTRLTNNGFTDSEPSISADGQRVAFNSSDGFNFYIYVVDTDGANLTRLTTDAAFDVDLSISADGQRIAFQSTRDGNAEIYVVDADGTNLTRLTTDAGFDSEPSMSADGQRVAFISNRDGNQEIYVVDTDGLTLPRRLTNNAATDGQPSISADGQRVAFRSTRDGNDEIYVVDADGRNLTNLSNNATFNADPSMSADGQRVAFRSFRDGNSEIYVVDADGTNLTNLSNNATFDADPSMSADGQRVAFRSSRDGNREIYVVNADGSNLTRLTTSDGFGSSFDADPSISGTTP